MKNKKAQGLPMNTIVIAALVLVVMIVLILIFTGNIGGWRGDVEKTETSAMARAKCIGKMGQVMEGITCPGTHNKEGVTGLGENLVCCIQKKTCGQQGGQWEEGGVCPHSEQIPITDTGDKKENHVCCK